MITIKLAIRNLYRHLKKTLVIGLLIVIGMALLFIANSIFDSTTDGLYSTFVHSVTGNLVIAEQADTDFGLFGSEIPIVSEYETIPSISSFAEISEILNNSKQISAWTAIVSGVAQINVNGYSEKIPVFGVNPETYFDVCDDINIVSGNILELANNGVFLNETIYKKIVAATGELAIGTEIIFSTMTNGSFKLRKGYFAGVHAYTGKTEILDKLVLMDATIVRGLVDYTMGFVEEDTKQVSEEDFFQIDDLFSDAEDLSSTNEDAIAIESVEEILSDTEARDLIVAEDSAAWSFVLLATDIKNLNPLSSYLKKQINSKGTNTRIMPWQQAAGTSVLILLAVQSAFYIGVCFIAFGAVLVIMNTLVLSVLDRTAEIGTMRSLGANKVFISKIFIAETMILTLVSALIGIILGIIVSKSLAISGITISNSILISLFGGRTITPTIKISSVLIHLLIAFVIASLSWIYPVKVANNIEPISAMNSD